MTSAVGIIVIAIAAMTKTVGDIMVAFGYGDSCRGHGDSIRIMVIAV